MLVEYYHQIEVQQDLHLRPYLCRRLQLDILDYHLLLQNLQLWREMLHLKKQGFLINNLIQSLQQYKEDAVILCIFI